MGLVSVQTVVKNALDGVQTVSMAGFNPPIDAINAYIAPPQVVTDTVTAPEVFVWGGRDVSKRLTAPRTFTHSGGFKRSEWELDVWVFFVDTATPSDSAFPMILDAIRWELEQIVYPQTILDSYTGANTQLVSIAEQLDLDFPPPIVIEDNESNLLYTARFICRATEDYPT